MTLSTDHPTQVAEPNMAQTAPQKSYGTRQFGAVNWLGLRTLYKKEVQRFLKVAFQTVLAPIISTLLFLMVFMGAWGVSGREVMMGDQAVAFFAFLPPGLIMMGILNNSFQNSSSSLIIGKVQGTIVDVLLPPLSPLELAIAFISGAATRGLLVGFVTACTVAIFTWQTAPMQIIHFGAIIYFALMAAILLAAIGVIAGIWAEKFDQLAMITNFVITPLTFLSGTFYSVHAENLPNWLPAISMVNPLFYVIDGFRFGFIGVSDANPAMGAIITFFLTSLFCFAAFLLLRSGYKLKT